MFLNLVAVSIAGLGPGLVEATLRYVSDPFDHVVIAVVEFRFKYFQVTNFESGASEWYLDKNGMKAKQ